MRAGSKILVFPAYRANPYLNLLMLDASAQGREVVRAHTVDDLVREALRLSRGDVLHVHWTTPIVQQAPGDRIAARRLRTLSALLRAQRARGVSVLWTIHNRLPHETARHDLEVRLHRLLAEAADAIHIMSPATPELLADIVRLPPEKVREIPHPSYEGIYDTGIDRAEARASFDLADERAALFLGQIRPYKGVDSLIAGAAEASGRPGAPEIALLLAGQVKEMPLDEFRSSLPAGLRTEAHLAFVDDGDIARWFLAADVAVFPYRAILNSGSVHLAATFRVPVVLPDEPHLRAQFAGETWVAFFDPARPEESIADLLADPDLFAGVDDASFEAFLSRITPWRVAERYADLVAELSVV
ncbi:glycosyltransferase [Microbacterium sp. gxy059]|uniref:glycosyltransferase n=1 Tax=Microbacterium sp. gxy059 TaxID=2957199 RepID=UPI003D959DC9